MKLNTSSGMSGHPPRTSTLRQRYYRHLKNRKQLHPFMVPKGPVPALRVPRAGRETVVGPTPAVSTHTDPDRSGTGPRGPVHVRGWNRPQIPVESPVTLLGDHTSCQRKGRVVSEKSSSSLTLRIGSSIGTSDGRV